MCFGISIIFFPKKEIKGRYRSKKMIVRKSLYLSYRLFYFDSHYSGRKFILIPTRALPRLFGAFIGNVSVIYLFNILMPEDKLNNGFLTNKGLIIFAFVRAIPLS